jgi:hypothetical protein
MHTTDTTDTTDPTDATVEVVQTHIGRLYPYSNRPALRGGVTVVTLPTVPTLATVATIYCTTRFTSVPEGIVSFNSTWFINASSSREIVDG